ENYNGVTIDNLLEGHHGEYAPLSQYHSEKNSTEQAIHLVYNAIMIGLSKSHRDESITRANIAVNTFNRAMTLMINNKSDRIESISMRRRL
ncbi:unnamed protein product, partial [Dovyalis caffra]